MHLSGVDTNGVDGVKDVADKDRLEQVFGSGKFGVVSSARGHSERLVLAPAFFKVGCFLEVGAIMAVGIRGAAPITHHMEVNTKQ